MNGSKILVLINCFNFWFWQLEHLTPQWLFYCDILKIFKNNLCLTQMLEYFQELYIIKKFLVICGEIEYKNNFRSWLVTKRFTQPKTFEMTKKLYILFFVFIKPLMVSPVDAIDKLLKLVLCESLTLSHTEQWYLHKITL